MVNLTIFEKVENVTLYNLIFALKWFLIYMSYMVIGSKLLPSEERKIKQINNTIKIYKLNGLYLFLFTTTLLILLLQYTSFTLIPMTTKIWSFFIVINIFAFLFSIYLYLSGVNNESHGKARLSNFWFGVEQNPELFGLDLKMFFYQPSLIGLFVFVLSFAQYQLVNYGEISLQMKLNVSFWWIYLLIHYLKEDFMLTTWDIIAENFGFMLVWGDMVYLPFLYSVCGWYLVDTSSNNDFKWTISLILLFTISHYIFRVSNLQKHQFKTKTANSKSWFFFWNRDIKTLNSKLLISGFWGIGRHLNYTGEILVYLSISLTTGCQSFVPYILPFSLLLVLIHRAHRDEQRCKQKYGQLWNDYCKIARFRMIPFIY